MLFVTERQAYMLKEMVSQNFVLISIVAVVTDLLWLQNGHKFYFPHCIYIPSLNSIAFMINELFTIMSWKCRHYSPEPCFGTTDPET